MTLSAPFPYFGGKRRAASAVWAALGDVGGYVEPFAGSAAVLLARPQFAGRRVETEIDYHARLAWLQERRTPELVAWLEGDPTNHDARAAGWWLYVLACGIGDPFGPGPWQVVDGHLRDTRKLPHLGDAGQGVNRELPHLGNAGRGVNRELPHLGDAGKGVLVAYMRTLAERLARVRITCGDWTRVLTPSVIRATAGNREIGVFLDPPYATSSHLYASTTAGVDAQVRRWCLTAPSDYRIVLAGYDNDHDELCQHGWRKEAGRAGGGAGYSVDPKAGRRERLWLSPACLGDDLLSLLAAEGAA